MTRSAPVALALLASMAAFLTGCTAASSLPAAPDPSPSPAPPTQTAPAPDPAAVLMTVNALATAPEGATLELALAVRQSLPATAAEASELRTLLTGACGPEFVDDATLDGEAWGLVRVDVSAQSTGAVDWPENLPVSLVSAPRGELGAAAVAASGDPLATPVDPAGELGPCLVELQVSGPGSGYLVLGIRGDFASADAQGLFWNGFRYGLSTVLFGESSGVELSDCVIKKTALGEKLTAPEVGYSERSDAAECSAGVPPAA
jgi:hypothetical protein